MIAKFSIDYKWKWENMKEEEMLISKISMENLIFSYWNINENNFTTFIRQMGKQPNK